jgi:hypothetical protein
MSLYLPPDPHAQALRNEHDFESLAVPLKFRNLGSFHSYYTGAKVAPLLTIIIGGNHEASNYMWELCVQSSYSTCACARSRLRDPTR